jgi:hypothetical protein
MLTVVNGPMIAAGESLSEAIDVSAGQMVRITCPPEWTEAPLTFEFSTDGMFFNEMFGIDGYAVKIDHVVPGAGVIIPSDIGRAIAHIKFRSGMHSQPVEQEAERWFAVTIYSEGSAPAAARSAGKRSPKKKAAKKKTRR